MDQIAQVSASVLSQSTSTTLTDRLNVLLWAPYHAIDFTNQFNTISLQLISFLSVDRHLCQILTHQGRKVCCSIGCHARKREKKDGKGKRKTTAIHHPSPQTSNMMLFNARLFDKMDEPSACLGAGFVSGMMKKMPPMCKK